ncbi:hypothetical protein C3L33_08675, partial [Rhododendron williamsianum]
MLKCGSVNTQAPSNVTDCSDRNYSKYYVVVVQYTARFNAETVKNFLYALNDGRIPKKKFNLRLAPEEISQKLTGYEHNGVTCVGMKTDIPGVFLHEHMDPFDDIEFPVHLCYSCVRARDPFVNKLNGCLIVASSSHITP